MRTVKSCGPDAPTLASSWRSDLRSDGGKQARSPGRARRKPLKPLRAGMPGEFGGPVVTTLVCYQHTAHEAAGAAGTRHSPRPLLGEMFMHNSGASRRGIAEVRFVVIGCLKIESEKVIERTRAPLSIVITPQAGDPVFQRR